MLPLQRTTIAIANPAYTFKVHFDTQRFFPIFWKGYAVQLFKSYIICSLINYI